VGNDSDDFISVAGSCRALNSSPSDMQSEPESLNQECLFVWFVIQWRCWPFLFQCLARSQRGASGCASCIQVDPDAPIRNLQNIKDKYTYQLAKQRETPCRTYICPFGTAVVANNLVWRIYRYARCLVHCYRLLTAVYQFCTSTWLHYTMFVPVPNYSLPSLCQYLATFHHFCART